MEENKNISKSQSKEKGKEQEKEKPTGGKSSAVEKKTTATGHKSAVGSAVWESVREGVSDMADTASLHLRVRRLENRRRSLYTKLGETTYAKLHPVHGSVSDDLEQKTHELVAKITDLNHQITELKLKIKMKKIGV